MLYIVSGTSRGGKSTIAKKMLESLKIPYVSLDWLVMGFTNGLPEYGIHDKLYPDQIASLMWRFVKPMCENILWVGQDYIIEGEAILPEQVSELIREHPDKVKVCFVGYTDMDISQKVNDVKLYSSGQNDWLANEPEDDIINHIRNMVEYSVYIKEQCKAWQIRYFDTSHNFMDTIDEAIKFLVEG